MTGCRANGSATGSPTQRGEPARHCAHGAAGDRGQGSGRMVESERSRVEARDPSDEVLSRNEAVRLWVRIALSNPPTADRGPHPMRDDSPSAGERDQLSDVRVDSCDDDHLVAAADPRTHAAAAHAEPNPAVAHEDGPRELGMHSLILPRRPTNAKKILRHAACRMPATSPPPASSRLRLMLRRSVARRRWRALRPLLLAAARIDLAVTGAQATAHRLLEVALPVLLTPDELADLSGRLYARRATSRVPFSWEEAWLPLLPPSPAHGLVGGAGYGPECKLLLQHGYTVDAYDPSPTGVAACAGILGDRGVAFQATHQEVADDSVPTPRARYDFVWLGWGSLSHVLDAESRARVLDACARLTDGPIFASCRSAETIVPRRAGARRLAKLGLVPRTGILFQPQVGLAATLPRAELAAVAARIGRRFEARDEPGITAVAWLPPSGSVS